MVSSVQKKLLLVEDEEIILKELSQTIEGFGYGYFTARTGEEAVESITKNNSINLIIMDINLGKGIDGIEASRMILSERKIPIVFFTSHIDRELMEKVSDITQYGFVIKNSGDDAMKLSIDTAFELFELNRINEKNMEDLSRSERQFKTVINNINVYIYFLIYENGVMADCFYSPQCFKITGYYPEEYKSDPGLWLNMVYEADRKLVQEYIAGVEAGKSLSPIEHRIHHKDGSVRWILNNFKVEKHEDGSINRMEGFIFDITERKAAEDALLHYQNNLEELVWKRTQEVQASEARYRLIADFAVDWESYSNASGEMVYLNKGFEKITGYSVSEGLSDRFNFENLYFPEDLPEIRNRLDEVFIHRKTITNFLHRIKHKDGSIRYVSLSSAPVITPEGVFSGVRSSIRDVTELKKLEQEKTIRDNYFINIQKLVSLSSLSSAIAHEIRQPLQLIKVITDTILLRYKKMTDLNDADKKNQKNLVELSSGVQRIDKIINSMYRLFKTSEKIEFHYLNLNSIVLNLVNNYQKKTSVCQIELRVVLENDPLRIFGDEILVEQVVTNIINNAVEALDSIQCEGKKITVRTRSESENIIIEISNNGPSIPEQIKDKMFEPLITTKKDSNSMGMGLYLVQNIVKTLNGKIEVYVNDFNETTFRVILH